MPDPTSFTGRTRDRKTKPTVHLIDAAARTLITVGGVGTILAVLTVCVFLVYVAVPVFLPAKLGASGRAQTQWSSQATQRPLHVESDEQQLIGWAMLPDGKVNVFQLDTKDLLWQVDLAPSEGPKLTAWTFSGEDATASLGYDDGTIRRGRIGFDVRFLSREETPRQALDLEVGQTCVAEIGGVKGVVKRTPEDQFRFHSVGVDLQEPLKVSQHAVLLMDQTVGGGGETFCVLTADGKLKLEEVRQRKDIRTRKVTTRLIESDLPFEPDPRRGPPMHLKLTGLGDNVLLVWEDGQAIRFDCRDRSSPMIAETLDLTPQVGVTVTRFGYMLGKVTFLVGDSTGSTVAWFRTRPESAPTKDGWVMTPAHRLPGPNAAVTAMGASTRTRLIALGYADGSARLYQVTSHKLLADLRTDGSPIVSVSVAPKDDGLLALSDSGLWRWTLDPGHPEITLASLFLPVWYESASGPEHVWQSTGGTDDFEPKFGLVPLIFGTIKATVYSLLFGVPLALLAAIYTSEFLHPRVKAYLKPTIELMASLPSVVLGFLAGNVIARFVEGYVPQVLAAFVAIPAGFLLGAHLWQMLPQHMAIRYAQWRFFCILLTLPASILAAMLLGPAMESVLFAGDIKAWLDGQVGSGWGGWFFILLPISAVGVAMLIARGVNPPLRNLTARCTRGQLALLSLGKFLLGAALACAAAAIFGGLLSVGGLDPRGSVVDTYVQRNAMIVGFVMGFAIIPIIYTLAEDALSTVPEHLRSASLGAGATPWQTATRIIIPTAASGLFSAVMIGLGRAVGETMIVLMAAGNTPLMEWNIFNGLRTLSANIAVELPEAVRGSTHYRTLFLAALCLFVMTFVLNTVAESVRQRFRKRAFQL